MPMALENLRKLLIFKLDRQTKAVEETRAALAELEELLKKR